MLVALFVGTGDRPEACRASVERGWARLVAPIGRRPAGRVQVPDDEISPIARSAPTTDDEDAR